MATRSCRADRPAPLADTCLGGCRRAAVGVVALVRIVPLRERAGAGGRCEDRQRLRGLALAVAISPERKGNVAVGQSRGC